MIVLFTAIDKSLEIISAEGLQSVSSLKKKKKDGSSCRQCFRRLGDANRSFKIASCVETREIEGASLGF